jgi:acyl carrier protein
MADLLEIKRIIAENLGIEEDKIGPEDEFTSLGADSIAQMELLMAFEEKFGISISDDEAKEITSLNKVAQFIAKKQN